ncbi:MAG: ribbon-helix-helix domain-containing protein [Planctomycetia bacterium]|nr:ribbon-helix-helix domain-containing protein [Planctomycetia bacterium]
MAGDRITLRVDESLQQRLEIVARAAGKSESQIVRDALEVFLDKQPPQATCFDVAQEAGLIGCVADSPADLSTNPKHMEGFGRG